MTWDSKLTWTQRPFWLQGGTENIEIITWIQDLPSLTGGWTGAWTSASSAVKTNSRFFPRNPNLDLSKETGNREQFKVNFVRTLQYKSGAIPFCQHLLNDIYAKEGEKEGQEKRKVGKVKGRKGEGRSKEGAGNVNYDLCITIHNGPSHCNKKST